MGNPPDTPHTLLIVDDNKSVRDSLRFLLERRGYHVMVAADGPEGVELARQHEIHGAMIDVNMPGMNGVEVCQQVTAHAAQTGRRVAVWLMTGARAQELVKSAQEAGALTVLAKPFHFAELFREFERVLGPVPPRPRAPDVLDEL